MRSEFQAAQDERRLPARRIDAVEPLARAPEQRLERQSELQLGERSAEAVAGPGPE